MAPKKKTKKKVAKRPAKRATQFTRSLRSTADQRGMGEGAVSREAGEATWALLQDPLTPVRNAAAFALASIRDPGIVQSFISALDGASSKEIARLAVLLGEAGFQNAAPYLKALFNKKDAKLSAALARGLGLLAERSAAPLLIEALDSDFVPVEAAEALGRLNAVEAFPALMRALSHKKDSVRAAAALPMGA